MNEPELQMDSWTDSLKNIQYHLKNGDDALQELNQIRATIWVNFSKGQKLEYLFKHEWGDDSTGFLITSLLQQLVNRILEENRKQVKIGEIEWSTTGK